METNSLQIGKIYALEFTRTMLDGSGKQMPFVSKLRYNGKPSFSFDCLSGAQVNLTESDLAKLRPINMTPDQWEQAKKIAGNWGEK